MAFLKLKRQMEGWLGRLGYSMPRKTELFKNREFHDVYEKCKAYTLTPVERMYGLYEAVRYVHRFKIPGDVVECGVWRGGSSMVMAETLLNLGDSSRQFYLYDTYAGMSEPTEKDISLGDAQAMEQWKKSQKHQYNEWCYASAEEVRKNLEATGYPAQKLHFVKGKVEDTLPKTIPGQIALLRLDTDWYESTLHEMNHLFPRLSQNGVLVIDDYGEWKGARGAIDEYLEKNNTQLLLVRTDYSGRIGVKI